MIDLVVNDGSTITQAAIRARVAEPTAQSAYQLASACPVKATVCLRTMEPVAFPDSTST